MAHDNTGGCRPPLDRDVTSCEAMRDVKPARAFAVSRRFRA